MYCVVKLYGDCEPWWFLEGWEEDIVAAKEFKDYEEAVAFYHKERQSLAEVGVMNAQNICNDSIH
nr:DUF1033 family protein [Streptococcus sp. X13SY08]